ncbi:MAG: NAD(P)H-dependent oxidoreductase, partial [Defluviitaleaceae bacterium]|nr:NAD(P)H-dependent oxidoreductase [Defluviitaleaceae bacterium]
MEILTLFGAANQNDKGLSKALNIASGTLKELGVKTKEINLMPPAMPYFEGTKNDTASNIIKQVSEASGIIIATTASMSGYSAVLQNFFEHLELSNSPLSGKHCMIIAIAKDGTILNNISNAIKEFGGNDSVRIALDENFKSESFIEDIIEKNTEDFYRLVRQKRNFYNPSYKSGNTQAIQPAKAKENTQTQPKKSSQKERNTADIFNADFLSQIEKNFTNPEKPRPTNTNPPTNQSKPPMPQQFIQPVQQQPIFQEPIQQQNQQQQPIQQPIYQEQPFQQQNQQNFGGQPIFQEPIQQQQNQPQQQPIQQPIYQEQPFQQQNQQNFGGQPMQQPIFQEPIQQQQQQNQPQQQPIQQPIYQEQPFQQQQNQQNFGGQPMQQPIFQEPIQQQNQQQQPIQQPIYQEQPFQQQQQNQQNFGGQPVQQQPIFQEPIQQQQNQPIQQPIQQPVYQEQPFQQQQQNQQPLTQPNNVEQIISPIPSAVSQPITSEPVAQQPNQQEDIQEIAKHFEQKQQEISQEIKVSPTPQITPPQTVTQETATPEINVPSPAPIKET